MNKEATSDIEFNPKKDDARKVFQKLIERINELTKRIEYLEQANVENNTWRYYNTNTNTEFLYDGTIKKGK